MTPLLLLLGAGAALTMGFAIQRGATCMVAALEETVFRRRATRLIALGEAAAIVTGGLIAARLLGGPTIDPPAWAATGWSLAGGVLLGLGALTAGACAFGSIARLGSGEWAYLAVPPGFLAGALAASPLLTSAGLSRMLTVSPTLIVAPLLLLPFTLFALWRLMRVAQAARAGKLAEHLWSPHVATSIIGLTFIVLLLAEGPWSYTDGLTEAARGVQMMSGTRMLLFLSLFGGTMLGGWTAGRWRAVAPRPWPLLRCFLGGALMGFGALLTPGSNDGLILLGLPLLQPHAITALAAMILTIVFALVAQQDRSLASERGLA